MHLWASVLAAFLLSLIGCWFIIRSTLLRKLANIHPADNRWHQQVTPGLGGVPIFFALAVVVVFIQGTPIFSAAILLAASLLMAFGVYDDLATLTPKIKLMGQLITATLALILIVSQPSNSNINFYHLIKFSGSTFSDHFIHLIFWCVCIGWIISITNAINLLDNMDGLTGGVSLIACIAIAFIVKQTPNATGISIFYFTLSASLAGFLILNYNPAKLFMGDAGALWIGLVVAIGTLIAMPAQEIGVQHFDGILHSYRWLIPIVICIVPIGDTTMVVITRKLRGQPASQGGSDHLSHRLVCLGLSQRSAVAILWAVAAIAAMIAILIDSKPFDDWFIPLCAYLLVVASGIVILTRITCAPTGVAIRRSKSNSL